MLEEGFEDMVVAESRSSSPNDDLLSRSDQFHPWLAQNHGSSDGS
jgi:hypothetical protein